MAGSENTIHKLVFWGHGQSGAQSLSRNNESARDFDMAGMAIETHRQNAPILSRLGTYLKKDALVELRGCEVANSDKGQVFIWALADLWLVRVRAGSGITHGVNFQWFGKVYEANPLIQSGVFEINP